MSVSERGAFNVFLGLNGYDVAQPGRTVTVTPSETVQHSLPSCGFHMGGASVSIFGTNVRVSSKVHVIFGALLRFCSFQSAALLICSNPRHPIGDASISASDDGYVCNKCSVSFSYRASYEIAQICPSSFSPHDSKTLVTVHGGQFYHDGSVFCRIDAVIFIGFYMSSEEIACRLVLSDTTLPAKYDVCVSNNGVGYFMGLPVLRTDQDVLTSNVFPRALSPMYVVAKLLVFVWCEVHLHHDSERVPGCNINICTYWPQNTAIFGISIRTTRYSVIEFLVSL